MDEKTICLFVCEQRQECVRMSAYVRVCVNEREIVCVHVQVKGEMRRVIEDIRCPELFIQLL